MTQFQGLLVSIYLFMFLTSRKVSQKWHTPTPLTKCGGCIWFLRTFFFLSGWISVSVTTIRLRLSGVWGPLDISCQGNLGKFARLFLSNPSEGGSIRHLFGFCFYLWENCMSVCPCKSVLVSICSCPFVYLSFPNKSRYKVLSIQHFGTLKSKKMDVLTLLLIASKSIPWILCPFY